MKRSLWQLIEDHAQGSEVRRSVGGPFSRMVEPPGMWEETSKANKRTDGKETCAA